MTYKLKGMWVSKIYLKNLCRVIVTKTKLLHGHYTVYIGSLFTSDELEKVYYYAYNVIYTHYILLIFSYCDTTKCGIYSIRQNIRGGKLSRFSQIFGPTAKVFPCMFCMLVGPIHYSDEKMALTS